MKIVFRYLAVVYLVLQLPLEVKTAPLRGCDGCDTGRCENVTLVQESCPEAQLVLDTCGCCTICGSRFGEPCGGAYGYLGTCEYDLKCTVHPSEYLNGVNISGICTRAVCRKNCTKRAKDRVCGNDGMWYRNICALRQSKFCKGTKVSEADSEVCDRACHELTVPEHGNITFSKGIAVTSVANITCQPPYILLSGSELRTCVQGRTRGTWNGTQPTCVKHPCELHQCETHERCVLNERNNTECVCGDECPRPQGDEWVCGTDGKSYPSRCHVKLRACQNSTPFLQPSYAGKCNPDEFPRKRKR